MAIPVIDTTSSILGFRQCEAWQYQPAITNSPAPTGWTWTGLPDGMSADPTTGLVSGAASESGVFLATAVATNGDGDSDPVVFTIGIYERSWMDEGSIPINIDVRTGLVFPHGRSSWQLGDPVIYGSFGDDLLLDIGFTSDGGNSLIPIAPSMIFVGLRLAGMDHPAYLSDGVYETLGEWDATRYRVLMSLKGNAFKSAQNSCGQSDVDRSQLCVIDWSQSITLASESVNLNRSSQPFRLTTAEGIQ